MLRRNEKVDLIKRVPLFADCSRGELEQIAQLADEIDLDEGKELTRLGESGREFFVLLEGEADVTQDGRVDQHARRGRLLRRDRARRGHASDRHGHRDHAGARARDHRPGFQAAAREQPEIQRKVLVALAERRQAAPLGS